MEVNTIYQEDCMSTISRMDDNSVDLVLTSPPYNIIRPNSTDRGYDLYRDGMSNDDYSKWCCGIFNAMDRALKKDGCIIWNMSYGCENTECMPLTIAEIIKNTNFTMADIIVWKKKSATPNNVSHNKLTRIVEFVYIFCRKSEFMTFKTNKKIIKQRETNQPIYENIFNFIEAPNNDNSTDLNKATFSSLFVGKLLNIYANDGSTVYDPFMGTGTTAIGCIRRKLNYIGRELSDAQCKYAERRIHARIVN